MRSIILRPLGVAALACAAYSAPASAQGDSQGVTISPMVGLFLSDDEYRLDDAPFGSVGLGYKFAGPGEVELTYLIGQADNEIGLERNFDQIRLDYLHHFGSGNKVIPYGAIGVGHQRLEWWSNDEKTENTLVNAGLGMNVFFNERVSFRADARVLQDVDYSFTNYTVSLGMRFFTGELTGGAPAPAARPPADTDGDGVADPMDRCPGTPAGTTVDSNGCAMTLDGDGDGVVDSKDECPDTSAGANVDPKGCYITLTETREVTMNVKFGNNSAEVDPGSYSEVEKLADFMTRYPQTDAVIEGHSDDRGAADYNLQLSQQRAQAVADVLVRRYSIDGSRVRAIGYGEERPLVDNDTPANRARNRRVTAQVSASVETRQ